MYIILCSVLFRAMRVSSLVGKEMETSISRSEANDYRYKCPVCGRLMHFLEEVDDMIAAYYCELCNKVRLGSWVK